MRLEILKRLLCLIILYFILICLVNLDFYLNLYFLQDISGGIDILGWQLDKDQLLIVISCAIIIIILISITIVFVIWYCCFCKNKTGNSIFCNLKIHM